MSIYGAINSATTGLDAQSKALENISGNVANSSTTGYKRLDTSFSDLVASTGSRQKDQVAGTVYASSRSTNNIAGDISSADKSTYMAINGAGYFVVTDSDGLSRPVPSNYYTRAGDFELNNDRYLVNSAGYFLQGYPVNQATGFPSDKLEPVRVSDLPMPAKPSTKIDYQANLPSTPTTSDYSQTTPNSQYVDLSVFAKASSFTIPTGLTTAGPPAAVLTKESKLDESTAFSAPDSLTIKLKNNSDVTFPIDANTTVQQLLDKLNSMHGVTADFDDATGKLTVNSYDEFSITGATGTALNMSLNPLPLDGATSVDRTSVTGAKSQDFIDSSIPGGSTTIYDENGTPLNVEMRWALNAEDKWTLYYNTNTKAADTEVAWKAITDVGFDAAGRMVSPADSVVRIPNLTVNGVDAGDIELDFGVNNLSQYEDQIGYATSVDLEQDGFAAGELRNVSVDSDGNVTGEYSNGRSQKLYKVPVATFSAEQELQRIDGAAFAETPTSGEPDFRRGGSIRSKALESSNADIAKEFSKLIVTQQAYSANSRVLSTANTMLDAVLNIVR